jgi:hypothetical protein
MFTYYIIDSTVNNSRELDHPQHEERQQPYDERLLTNVNTHSYPSTNTQHNATFNTHDTHSLKQHHLLLQPLRKQRILMKNL